MRQAKAQSALERVEEAEKILEGAKAVLEKRRQQLLEDGARNASVQQIRWLKGLCGGAELEQRRAERAVTRARAALKAAVEKETSRP